MGSDEKLVSSRWHNWSDGGSRPHLELIHVRGVGTVVEPGNNPNRTKQQNEVHGRAKTRLHTSTIRIDDYVTSCSWSSSLTPPYETATVHTREIPFRGTLKDGTSVDLGAPTYAYLRVVVPKGAKVDPGRVLWLGTMTTYSENNESNPVGLQETTVSMNFVGFYDLASDADVLAMPSGLGSGQGHNYSTMISMQDVTAISTRGALSTMKTKKLGSYLEAVWNGGSYEASYKPGQGAGEGDKYTVSYNGLARIIWPAIDMYAVTGNVKGGNFGYMYKQIAVLWNNAGDGAYANESEKKNTGIVISPVPGVATTADGGSIMSTFNNSAQIGSLISGTFKCDTNMVEVFPTIIYDAKQGTSRAALVYKMKPFRNTTGSEFIKFQKKFSETTAAKRLMAAGRNANHMALWRKALAVAERRAALLDEAGEGFHDILSKTFGKPVWSEAKEMAVKIKRNFIFSMSRSYSLGKQINTISASHIMPSPTHEQSIVSGLPLMSRHRAEMEGVRHFKAQWKHLLYDVDKDLKPIVYEDPKTGRKTVRVKAFGDQLRAVALEATHTLMNGMDYAQGTCSVSFNPDIRPGRAVSFPGLNSARGDGSSNPYAYCVSVEHRFDADEIGGLTLRTVFQYDWFLSDEGQRGYSETVLSPETAHTGADADRVESEKVPLKTRAQERADKKGAIGEGEYEKKMMKNKKEGSGKIVTHGAGDKIVDVYNAAKNAVGDVIVNPGSTPVTGIKK